MREIKFSNSHDASMYNKGYEQGRADERSKAVLQAFKWLMRMDIIDCDGCDYQSECTNRNMNCYEVMAEHFLESLKSAK